MFFQDQDISKLFLNYCIIQEQRCEDMTLSLYFQNIKMSWIAYLAVLCSEGYSIYDTAYYSCPGYDNILSVYVILLTF